MDAPSHMANAKKHVDLRLFLLPSHPRVSPPFLESRCRGGNRALDRETSGENGGMQRCDLSSSPQRCFRDFS